MLELYNSLTKRKEPFRPIEPGKVRMYVCGMTVYDFCHLGHARALVVFDVVARWLRASGYELTFVRNITDVDDKIIKRANELGEPIDSVTARFIQAMHEDAQALGCRPPDREPRATQAMDAMQALIGRLMDKGIAYVGDNGDVYYDVSRFADYGKLSGRKQEEQLAGARVEVESAKRNPADFVLWKGAKPGEPSWPSPWGDGRPGWHIECSAMAMENLGENFDIHGGGVDLQFPHHENEIAQSEGATGHPYANFWLHNGHVRIDDEKMSKSLGNFFTVRQILGEHKAEAVRYFLLSSHYRSPLNYTADALSNAEAALTRLYTALRGIEPASVESAGADFRERFAAAMDDDFSTPEALAVLFDVARELNRLRESDARQAAALAGLLRELGAVLGLLQADPEGYLKGGTESDAEAIEALIARRAEARKNRDFAEADRIRDELAAQGVVIEDSAGGTTWRRG